MIWDPKAFRLFIFSPIIRAFMRDTAGNSSVWYKVTETRKCQECIFTDRCNNQRVGWIMLRIKITVMRRDGMTTWSRNMKIRLKMLAICRLDRSFTAKVGRNLRVFAIVRGIVFRRLLWHLLTVAEISITVGWKTRNLQWFPVTTASDLSAF